MLVVNGKCLHQQIIRKSPFVRWFLVTTLLVFRKEFSTIVAFFCSGFITLFGIVVSLPCTAVRNAAFFTFYCFFATVFFIVKNMPKV
jgi:hypothetical protein